MVTFALPGDSEMADAGNTTPRPRPPLPFAKRAYVSTPYGGKRLSTGQASSARKLLTTRDEIPASSLNRSSIATSRNIFRSSTSDSPSVAPFSPSLPQSTTKKVFALGATPEPGRVFRASTTLATPRGMSARATSKDLFTMRIEDPDPELSGEALTEKIPKDWSSKASIYADQYLAHLCPPEFDEEQRRQFFCILDLRRLKYAANEIFVNKDWKLNVTNFAKEFEKSRGIILLRYGLYEFQNVKPSKEVLKRWRREHGLPEPEEEDVEPSPSKAASVKKRKADDDLSKDTSPTHVSPSKRRAPERVDEATPVATPQLQANKRKASEGDGSEDQRNKLQRSTPSAAKSLFEKITNKSSTTPAGSPMKSFAKPAEESPAVKPRPFAANKPNNSLARSMFQNMKPANTQGVPNGGNPFAHLSDSGSAKNSGADADSESESETNSEQEDNQEADKSDEPSETASGAETASQIGSGLFANKPSLPSGLAAGSASGTRESTPSRSLFDRVTTDSDGQLMRAEHEIEAESTQKSVAADQTWNPSTTPLKFAPTAPQPPQSSSLFGNGSTPKPAFSLANGASASGGPVFAPKSNTSNIFGGNQEKSAEKEAPKPAAEETGKTGYESDKENETAPKKSMFQPKAPETQSSFGSSLFQPNTAEANQAKPASSLFGAPSKADDKPEQSSAPSIFGTKPAEPAAVPKSAMQSSTLFGNNNAASDKPTTLFGSNNTAPESSTAGSLFGSKPAANASNIFGNPSSTPAKPLFGAPTTGDGSVPKSDAPAAPTFSFGGDKANDAPLFSGAKSPTSGPGSNLFGSPMKQDQESPAKKAFAGGITSAPPPIFNLKPDSQSSSSSNMFGNTSNPTNGTSNAASIFGGAGTSNPGSGGGFNFNFGATSGSTGTNPFASSNAGDAAGSSAPSGGMFNFGASAPSASGSSPFQFGGASSNAPPPSAIPAFGGASSNAPPPSAVPAFGGAPSTGGTPQFNFTSASPAPQQTSGFSFGQNQAPTFLQPPAGGASTTGTNSPFSLGGGSSLATTPAGGTPEPSAQAGEANGGDAEEGEKQEQINLTEGAEADEENLHEVRAKVLKFLPAGDKTLDEEKEKSKPKSPWSTQGIGPLRLLKHKETNVVRLLLRAEPRGHVALNRAVLPNMCYKADEKYVKLTTSNEKGDGLETWMVQVKTKDLAKELAEALEKHKELNKK